jgi:hypothetical protein
LPVSGEGTVRVLNSLLIRTPFDQKLPAAQKKPLLWMKRGLYDTVRRRFVYACSPFHKEGGAVSGDTRRPQSIGIIPP